LDSGSIWQPRALQRKTRTGDADYEVAALVGLKVSKKVILQAGWRYLDVDYRTNAPALFVYDVHQSGGIAGVTMRLK
jgi:hypothetical protein